MKLTKNFIKIKEIFPNVTFHKNSSGPGVLLNFHDGTYCMYANKLYSGKTLKEFLGTKDNANN